MLRRLAGEGWEDDGTTGGGLAVVVVGAAVVGGDVEEADAVKLRRTGDDTTAKAGRGGEGGDMAGSGTMGRWDGDGEGSADGGGD